MAGQKFSRGSCRSSGAPRPSPPSSSHAQWGGWIALDPGYPHPLQGGGRVGLLRRVPEPLGRWRPGLLPVLDIAPDRVLVLERGPFARASGGRVSHRAAVGVVPSLMPAHSGRLLRPRHAKLDRAIWANSLLESPAPQPRGRHWRLQVEPEFGRQSKALPSRKRHPRDLTARRLPEQLVDRLPERPPPRQGGSGQPVVRQEVSRRISPRIESAGGSMEPVFGMSSFVLKLSG